MGLLQNCSQFKVKKIYLEFDFGKSSKSVKMFEYLVT